jgi:hypothetical protein
MAYEPGTALLMAGGVDVKDTTLVDHWAELLDQFCTALSGENDMGPLSPQWEPATAGWLLEVVEEKKYTVPSDLTDRLATALVNVDLAEAARSLRVAAQSADALRAQYEQQATDGAYHLIDGVYRAWNPDAREMWTQEQWETGGRTAAIADAQRAYKQLREEALSKVPDAATLAPHELDHYLQYFLRTSINEH